MVDEDAGFIVFCYYEQWYMLKLRRAKGYATITAAESAAFSITGREEFNQEASYVRDILECFKLEV